MRALGLAMLIGVATVGLGWLLGPHSPAPELPSDVVGVDDQWIARAEEIGRWRRWLTVANLVLTPTAWWLFVRSGWSAALRAWLESNGIRNEWLLVGTFTTLFVLASTLINGPLLYAGLALRRAYGLSQETTAAWLVRQAKEFAVALVLTLIMVEGLYWTLRIAPQRWWLLAAAGVIIGSILLTYLAPYVITPLFFTQQPLQDQSLRAEIFALGERVGVPISEVYVIDASTQGNEGNAYFTGIGGATRVVLYDTLLQQYPRPELLTILAHELGHWRLQHVWKGLALSFIAAPLGLWLLHVCLGWLLPAWGVQHRADIAGLPLIMLLASLAALPALPIQNWISRQWEREADRFALQATGDSEAFQATFVRLARQNLGDPSPPPLFEGIFATHPAVGRRIAYARSPQNP